MDSNYEYLILGCECEHGPTGEHKTLEVYAKINKERVWEYADNGFDDFLDDISNSLPEGWFVDGCVEVDTSFDPGTHIPQVTIE